MKCDLSVIIPIYNVEKYLEQAIQSLLNQKEYSYEIILVNDGSTDGCQSICEQYASKYASKIKVVNKQNGGLPSARKAGVRVSGGEYITFLDGDDWVDADYYYNMLTSAKENNAHIVCSSYYLSYPNGEVACSNAVSTGVYFGEKLESVRERVLYNEPYYTYGIMPSLCMKVIRKSCLEKYIYNVPDEVTLAEDASCTFPILFSCEKLVVLNENIGYHYRQIETSMSYTYDSKKVRKVMNVMDYLDSALEPYYQKYNLQIDMFYTHLIKELAKNELLGNGNLKSKKEKINLLLDKEYAIRALEDLRKLPFSYGMFFLMLRERKIAILNVVYTLYKRLRKR